MLFPKQTLYIERDRDTELVIGCSLPGCPLSAPHELQTGGGGGRKGGWNLVILTGTS